MSCSLGGGEEEEASVWAYWGRSTQVSPSLHSTFRPVAWSPLSQQWSYRPPQQVAPRPPVYLWLTAPPQGP
jgi:hypothetical protein